MKAKVAMTLIICGTVLFLTPFITHVILSRQVADTMARMNKSVDIRTQLPRSHHTACMIAGGAMILTGTTGALKQKKKHD